MKNEFDSQIADFPLKIGQICELNIEGVSSEGHGIGRFAGVVVFVPLALPEERVLVKISELKKQYAIAELLETKIPSSKRETPMCTIYGRCGACTLMHMNYEAQLELKRIFVKDTLERIGRLKDIDIEPTIGMNNPLRYRNKAAFSFGNDGDRVFFGCYERKSHRLVEVKDCLLQNEASIRIMKAICAWANDFGIKAYELSGKGKNKANNIRTYKPELGAATNGILRNGIIRITAEGIMVVLVTTGPFPKRDELIDRLRKAEPRLVSLVHNINKRDSSLIAGEKSICIYGKGIIREELDGLEFDVSAESFLQVNPKQTLKLYSAVVDVLNLTKADTAIDLYCGIGTISLMLARKAKRVIGIEAVSAAVEDAKRNAERNGINNVEFICGDVEKVFPSIISSFDAMIKEENDVVENKYDLFDDEWNCTKANEGSNQEKIAALVMDPPRKGAEPEAIKAIIASGIKKLVYVSCNPSTLARDCRLLIAGGYKVNLVQPVDMFPETEHVETVVLMSRIED